MTQQHQHTTPLVVPSLTTGVPVRRLKRLPLQPGTDASKHYTEAWVQRLIHEFPDVLPVADIEPAYSPFQSICLELRTSKDGYIDNFYITSDGNLLFAECKLWRNSEARREVVAQVMDYIDGIASWGYSDLEAAVQQGILPDGSHPQGSLFELAGGKAELAEEEFEDAVARNLRRGRALFMIVGDGIREDAESLVARVQAHAGLHFALALIELSLFELAEDGAILVQPRVIARTVNIERGIVRVDDSRIVVTPPESIGTAGGKKRPVSLTEEQFYEQISYQDKLLPARVRRFLERTEELGVTPEFKQSLILAWYGPYDTRLNLGFVDKRGVISTDPVNWKAEELGIVEHTHNYIQDLANAIGGTVKVGKSFSSSKQPDWYVVVKGKIPHIAQLLGHEDAWVAAIERLADGVRATIEQRER